MKKSHRRPSDFELKLQKLVLLIDIVSLFVEKSHRSPSDLCNLIKEVRVPVNASNVVKSFFFLI